MWVTERNIRCPDDVIEEDILLCCSDTERASYVLRLFVLEVRKQNGEHSPPSALRSVLSGLNREFARNKIRFGILDKNDTCFLDLRQTLDTVNSQLHREGNGVATKHASILMIEDENLCWEKRQPCTYCSAAHSVLLYFVAYRFYLFLHASCKEISY